jgi:hypothetical protein
MNPGRLRTGVFLIITGVILLLNTTGALAWSFWVDLIWLWPMLLIAVGVEKLLLATRAKNLAYISSLILIITVFWAYSTYARGPSSDDPVYQFDADFTQAYAMDTTINALAADIDFGAGRLVIGSTSEQLFDGNFYSKRGRPRVTKSDRRGRATVRVRGPEARHFHWPSKLDNKWQVDLTDRLPVRLNIDCGAARLLLNLEDVQLERFEIDCGASRVDLTIGAKSARVDGSIDCGASDVKIKIPHGAGLRVQRDAAITSFCSGEIELLKRGSYRVPDNFNYAAAQIKLQIDAGVSFFKVSYSDQSVGTDAI